MSRLLQLLVVLAWLVGGLAVGPAPQEPGASSLSIPHVDDPWIELGVQGSRIRLVVRTPWDTTWRAEAPLPSLMALRRSTASTPSRRVPPDRHGAPTFIFPHPHPPQS